MTSLIFSPDPIESLQTILVLQYCKQCLTILSLECFMENKDCICCLKSSLVTLPYYSKLTSVIAVFPNS